MSKINDIKGGKIIARLLKVQIDFSHLLPSTQFVDDAPFFPKQTQAKVLNFVLYSSIMSDSENMTQFVQGIKLILPMID